MNGVELSVQSAAREAPDRLALIADDRTYTYAQLAESARRVAEDLQARRAAGSHSVDAPLTIVASREPGTVITLLAAFELGLPAGLMHAGSTGRELRALSEMMRAVPEAGSTGSAGPILAVVPTSGTRGTPKGVLLSRRAFLASAAASARNLGWEAEDRWLLALPLAHVGGLSILVRALAARRCVVLAGAGPFDAMEAIRAIDEHRITLVSLVPPMLQTMLEAHPAWSPPEHLRALLLGGGPASPDLLAHAADRGVPVLTTYGLSETCSQVTTQRYGTVNRGEMGSGSPLEGVELRIVDGEIQVRGPMLFSGYLEGGHVSSGLGSDGWFSTGDEGELDERGRLHVRGRLDRRIVTGGENVDPLEVEAALRSLPSIRDAVAFGVDDAKWGSVVAVALVLEGRAPGPPALREEMESTLASYKRPRLFCFLPRLPTTAAGKVDRAAAEAAARADLQPI